ncbi:uncharacterized protein DC041_0004052, partial [Schistosoma bovis]
NVYSFLLQPSSSVSSLPLNLWYIFISDCSLKLLSIFIKSVSLLCLSKTLDCYSMGSLLCFLEYIFLFLRHIPPGILWIYFLVELNWKLQGILAGRIFVCLLYCILKVSYILTLNYISVLCNVCIILSLCKEFMKFSRSIICTKHKFCAKCTTRWFNTFTNCPSCNPECGENSRWRSGSMDLFIQFY